MENRLAELTIPDYMNKEERCRIVDKTLGEYATGLPHNEPMQLSGSVRAAIDRCFAHDSIAQIWRALEDEAGRAQGSPVEDAGGEAISFVHEPKWAQDTLKAFREKSPLSLKVTLKQMQLGADWTIRQAFEREHQIAAHFMEHPDFVEGVSARLIRKPAETPKWQSETVDAVDTETVNRFFEVPEGLSRLTVFKDDPQLDYSRSPYEWLGLPKEHAIRSFIERNSQAGPSEVVQHFIEQQKGKPGVIDVVADILARKTSAGKGGNKLVWRI